MSFSVYSLDVACVEKSRGWQQVTCGVPSIREKTVFFGCEDKKSLN